VAHVWFIWPFNSCSNADCLHRTGLLALVAGIVLSPYLQSAWMLLYLPLHLMTELAVMRFAGCSVSDLMGIRRLHVL
jgi:hypothetical protein